MKFASILICAMLAIVPPAAAETTAETAPLAPAALERAVDRYLQPLLDTNNFSGVILVTSKGERLVEKGYGYASLEHQVRNSPQSVFQIASVSKPFTAAAIMLLAESRKLELHAPLSKVLPGYPNGDKLTIHHLLSHTSGIPNINDFPEYEDLQRDPHTPSELVALFRDKPLEFEPGARYAYSNSNYNLLALIIEQVSGSTYGDFLDNKIIRPMGLEQTGHRRSHAQVIPGAATGYSPAGSLGLERAGFLDWSVKTGNGSLYSDAKGVARFMRAIHRGELLNQESLKKSFTRHTPNVGYGWFLTEANGREIHHVNGRSPGFAAQADHYVKDDVTVVVLANSYISVTTDIARAVGAMLFGAPVKPMPALSPQRLDAKATNALVGEYQFGPDYYVPKALITVRTNDGHLEALVGEHGPYAFVPITPTRFLIRSFWMPAQFTIGPKGQATELSIDAFKGFRR